MSKVVFLCIWLTSLVSLVSCVEAGQGIAVDKTWAYLEIINKSPIDLHWPPINYYSPDEIVVPTGVNKTYPFQPLKYRISRDEYYMIMSCCNGVEVRFPAESWIGLRLDNRSINIGDDFYRVAEGGHTYQLTVYTK